MKVLLCSPYDCSGKNPGGISVWAKNIYEYFLKNFPELELDLYPCDRGRNINENTSLFKRLLYGLLDYSKLVCGIIRKVRTDRYDVVHITSTASVGTIKDIILCRLLKNRSKVFIHYHFGRIPELAKQNNLEWRMLLKTVKLANQIIVMDNASYRTLKDFGLNNVVEIPNPYSPELDEAVAELTGKVERKLGRVLFISRVFRKKGIYELVKACSKLSGVELRIVGPYDNVDKDNLMSIAGNQDWIHFIGPVSHDKVISELMACEICCLPTYTEGFPNIVLECMLSKTPLITTPVGAIPQMMDMEGESCGVFVKPYDVEGLRDAIAGLLKDEDKQKAMVETANQRVRKLYNVMAVAELLYNEWMSRLQRIM